MKVIRLNKAANIAFGYLSVYLLLALLFFSSLVLVNSIPTALIRDTVAASYELLDTEGLYPTSAFSWRPIVYDNFTDALMLNTALSVDSTRPVWSTLTNPRFALQKSETDQIKNLGGALQNERGVTVFYERYWHGYLVFLRPLLALFDLSQIRLLLKALLYLGSLYFIIQLFKERGIQLALAVTVGLLSVDFIFIYASIQFSSIFLISILSAIIFLRVERVRKAPLMFAFVMGGLTAYFDLLTAPLVSLGFLLILFFGLRPRNEWVKAVALWFAGYALLWATKWILADVWLTSGSVATALEQILNRTVTKADANFSHVHSLQLNVLQLIGYHRMSQFFFLIASILAVLILGVFGNLRWKKVRPLLPWFIAAVIPYAWYFVVANHSYLHVWYTYRNQFITVVSLAYIFLSLVNFDAMKNLVKRFFYK